MKLDTDDQGRALDDVERMLTLARRQIERSSTAPSREKWADMVSRLESLRDEMLKRRTHEPRPDT